MEPGDRYSRRLLESALPPTKYMQPQAFRDDMPPANGEKKSGGTCPRGSYNEAMPLLSAAHHQWKREPVKNLARS